MAETMLTYINEQPNVLERMLKLDWKTFAEIMKERPCKKIIFTASGTSYNAAAAAKHFIKKLLEIEVEVFYPFSFTHYENTVENNAIVIGISQGGGSTATIDALKKAEKQDCYTVALTANSAGPIVKAARQTIIIPCGEEKVVFRTKGYTSTLFSLYLMTLEAALETGKITIQMYENYQAELIQLIDRLPSIISESDHWYMRNRQQLRKAKDITVIGYGPNYATSLEGGLKLIETVRCPVMVYELEEFMHGPHLALQQSSVIFLIASKGAGQERTLSLYNFLQQVTPHAYLIASEQAATFHQDKDMTFNPNTSEEFSPLEVVIPFQLLSYRLSVEKEINLSVSKFPDFHQRLKTKIK